MIGSMHRVHHSLSRNCPSAPARTSPPRPLLLSGQSHCTRRGFGLTCCAPEDVVISAKQSAPPWTAKTWKWNDHNVNFVVRFRQE